MKAAAARIKINKLLESAGWRYFERASSSSNIQPESNTILTSQALNALGENFEKGFPIIVLEAEDKNPLVGKEQARKYAKAQNCRFVILSNGNLHYFWDLERGNPYLITTFPSPASVMGNQKSIPDPQNLIQEIVDEDYVVLIQRPHCASEAAWKNENEQARFIDLNGLRFLRPYQKKVIYAIQQPVKKGSDRLLLEMATGTGKTLRSAAPSARPSSVRYSSTSAAPSTSTAPASPTGTWNFSKPSSSPPSPKKAASGSTATTPSAPSPAGLASSVTATSSNKPPALSSNASSAEAASKKTAKIGSVGSDHIIHI